MESLGKGDYSTARASFEEAVKLDDKASAGHLGLGTAYYHLREDRLAERALLRALELSPNDAVPYQILGELYYRKDDIESALSYWEKAVQLNPTNDRLRARLERIRREHLTERNFNRDVTSHFLIKYEGREKIETGRIILRILEDAYGDIGRELSFYPSHEIQVILYSDRQFREVTDAPDWSGGIYDGKIRIPIGGIEQETPALRRILYHEYTHAALRMMSQRLPAWLNEGLAQYFEGREISDQEQRLLRQPLQADRLPGLKSLEGSFMGMGREQAAYAYLVSLSAVKFMIDRYGMYRVKKVIEELGRGADTARAIESGISISYEELEHAWRRSLD